MDANQADRVTFGSRRLNALLAVFGLLGAALFGAVLMISLLRPVWIESAARQMLTAELQQRTYARLQGLDETALGAIARRVVARNSERIAALKQQLSGDLPARVDAVVLQMLQPDCECRNPARSEPARAAWSEVESLQKATERLQALIRTHYFETAAKLHRELRIFAGTNGLIFLALGLIASLRQRAGPHLLPSALALFASMLIVAGFYLFGQDWLRSILFNDYVGFGYSAWIGVIALPLVDIVVNRGRIVTSILNGLLEAVGSATSVCSC